MFMEMEGMGGNGPGVKKIGRNQGKRARKRSCGIHSSLGSLKISVGRATIRFWKSSTRDFLGEMSGVNHATFYFYQ
jgi:hypothetical protein